MTRTRVGIAVLVAFLVTGCTATRPSVPVPTQSSESSASVPAQPTTPAAAPEGAPMSVERRKRDLPPGFPLEIPVPAGTVATTTVSGGHPKGIADMYTYVLETTSTPAGLAAWYQVTYTAAHWSGGPSSKPAEKDATRLDFTKAGGDSIIEIAPTSSGARATVRIAFFEPAPGM